MEGAFEGAFHGPTFVPTHRPPTEAPADPPLRFVTDLAEGVTAAQEAAGDRYVNVLGAHVARQCLEAGLLDDVLVFVAQVLLGDGTRLGEWSGRRQVDLVPPSVLPGRGAASLWHDVFPPSRRVTTRRALGVRSRRLSVHSLVTCRLGVRSGYVLAD